MDKKYIEHEALISDLKKLPEQALIEYMGIYDCIKSQPIADVQEVRHGKWIINIDGYYPYCSECGKEPKEMSEFCPKCGAKMDKE